MDSAPRDRVGGGRAGGRLRAEEEDAERGHRAAGNEDIANKDRRRFAALEEPSAADRQERLHLLVVPARTGRSAQPASALLPKRRHLHLLRNRAGRHQSVLRPAHLR